MVSLEILLLASLVPQYAGSPPLYLECIPLCQAHRIGVVLGASYECPFPTLAIIWTRFKKVGGYLALQKAQAP